MDEADEGLGVAVGDIHTDVTDAAIGTLHDAAELVVIVRRNAQRVESRRRLRLGGEKGQQLLFAIVLVQGDRQVVFGQRPSHFKGAGGIHVGSDDRNAAILLLRMEKNEFTGKINFRTRSQRRALGADEDILEVEFQILFDTHVRAPGVARRQKELPGNKKREKGSWKSCLPRNAT